MQNTTLRQVVYASSATVRFTDGDLTALLDKARQNNARNGITGVLIYLDGSFIQLLEGEEPALSETFERITSDSRHAGMMKLSDRLVAERGFPEQEMGCRAISECDLSRHGDLFVHDGGRWSVNPGSNIDDRLRVIFDTFFRINSYGRY
ncbi:MAG: BLUF domain-containing protein [Alphaproteobacteria bacterium]